MVIWITILTWILACIGFFFKAYDYTIIFSFASFLFFFHTIVRNTGLNSITVIFLILFGLYGYSVPLSICFGSDIGEYRLTDLQSWFSISDSLYSFVMINHLALLGMIIAFFISNKKQPSQYENNLENFQADEIRKLSYLVALLSGLFEIINFIRAGGFGTLTQGKLIYQSAISDLTLTLPSELLCYLSFILWSVSIKEFRLIKLVLIILFNIVFLALNFYIGERGSLLTIAIILFLGFTYKIRIRVIKLRYILAFLLLYVAGASMAVYRNIFNLGLGNSINYSLVSDYFKENKKTMLFLFNPANSEFGTSCLNYRVYYEQEPDKSPQYGLTYLHFLTKMLPERMNPFYDQSITVKFRDQFFPERGIKGAIGGTAFSSLMEAYMNFREFGGLIVYLIIFYLFLNMESARFNSRHYFIHCLYLILVLIALLFHRSSLEYVISSLIYILLFLGIILLVYQNMKIWFSPVNKNSLH